MGKWYLLFVGVFVLIISFVYVYCFMQASNDRSWEFGMDRLPHIKIHIHTVDIGNFRNFRYKNGKTISSEYINRSVDLNKLERAWFVVEPFEGSKYFKFNGIAHTYFVFDFADNTPVVISVEARREKGEQFGLLPGILNKFELIYVWGAEEDLTMHRVLIENNSLYMYPLTISKDSAKKLFLKMAETTKELETKPRFYNTLTSNCTNELAKNANKIKPNTIPINLVWFFPGYAVKELYQLGFIPNNAPLEDVSKKYYVSDLIKKISGKENFSELLRKKL